MDCFHHFDAWPHHEGDGLRLLPECGLLEVFGMVVLEEKKGEVKDRLWEQF